MAIQDKPLCLKAFVDHRGHTHKAVIPQRDIVRKGGIHAQKAAGSDAAIARKNHMRGQEAVIANPGLVADVIARPQHTALSDLNAVLDRIILKDKGIFTDFSRPPDKGMRADKAGQPVALGLSRSYQPGAHPVQLGRGHRDMGLCILGIKAAFSRLQRDHGQAELGVPGQELLFNGKPYNLVVAIDAEILIGDIGKFAGPDDQ